MSVSVVRTSATTVRTSTTVVLQCVLRVPVQVKVVERKNDDHSILPTSTSPFNTVRVGVRTTSTSTGTPNSKNDLHSSDSMYQRDITYGCKVPNAIFVSRFWTRKWVLCYMVTEEVRRFWS